MQIILLEKVVNVGNLGDVVKVKDGYARNFLIPQKLARRATAAAVAEFEAKRAELEKAAVRLPTGPLKTTGEFPVAVALHTDVVVEVTVAVVGEAA